MGDGLPHPPKMPGFFQEQALTRLVAALWLAFVATLSLMPLEFKYHAGTMGIFHNPGHFLIFAVTAILLCKDAGTVNGRMLRWAGACSFAIAMEILEWAVYHHAFEWQDVGVDLTGAALGLIVVSLWHRRANGSAEQQNV